MFTQTPLNVLVQFLSRAGQFLATNRARGFIRFSFPILYANSGLRTKQSIDLENLYSIIRFPRNKFPSFFEILFHRNNLLHGEISFLFTSLDVALSFFLLLNFTIHDFDTTRTYHCIIINCTVHANKLIIVRILVSTDSVPSLHSIYLTAAIELFSACLRLSRKCGRNICR